jgi:NAD(P)-dependent dehydrogenase (short-subunit alcohol dehydrogenase family)
MEAHTVGLAAELAGTGVTVNIVRPGPVDTAMPACRADHIRGLAADRSRPRRHRGHLTRTAATGAVLTHGFGSGRAVRIPVLPPHSMRSTATARPL